MQSGKFSKWVSATLCKWHIDQCLSQEFPIPLRICHRVAKSCSAYWPVQHCPRHLFNAHPSMAPPQAYSSTFASQGNSFVTISTANFFSNFLLAFLIMFFTFASFLLYYSVIRPFFTAIHIHFFFRVALNMSTFIHFGLLWFLLLLRGTCLSISPFTLSVKVFQAISAFVFVGLPSTTSHAVLSAWCVNLPALV